MAKLSSLAASKTRRILLYGPPKVGKTQLAGGLAERFNLLWFDLERGKDTLFKLPQEWQERINVITIPDTKPVPIAAETMLKVFMGRETKICTLHGKVNCPLCLKSAPNDFEVVDFSKLGPNDVVVIDSLTQFSVSALNNIIRNQPDDYKPERDDWGNLKVVVDKLGTFIQAAPFNIVCISHEESVNTVEKGKDKIVPVLGSRTTSRNSAKYFDDVIYAEVANGQHKFASSTTYKASTLTGSRSGFKMESSKDAKLLDLWEQGG